MLHSSLQQSRPEKAAAAVARPRPGQLAISLGQHSDRGRKPRNQDFHGACIPQEPQLSTKGIAIALADGISSSEVSHIASESAVASFLSDYYCTSESWTVKKSAQCVLTAANSWLFAQTRQSQYRYDRDKGYVCTLSALVLKGTQAHLFHVGDARIYRLRNGALEPLTEDHRLWLSAEQSYLSRAMGIHQHLEIDYQTLPLELGDIFVLATDGAYEYVPARDMVALIQQHADDLDQAARAIIKQALTAGSPDNLTVQIARIDQLPEPDSHQLTENLRELPLPPALEARSMIDGYRIMQTLHCSSRSHVYLALDTETGDQVVLKTPASDILGSPLHLERFLMEEWIARRINSEHVLKPYQAARPRSYLYLVTEYVEGVTLSQWMVDNPRPGLETVRSIVEQIAKGLRAFHRLEMLHQDLRPANILIDRAGKVKLIDFGSTRVAGLQELAPLDGTDHLLGTAQYTAPEYFLGENGSPNSDLFSLGVITYQMLSGMLPYGAEVAKIRTRADLNKLNYHPLSWENRDIPPWVDGVLRKAVHPNPQRRYQELSEFLFDLRHPSPDFLKEERRPLAEQKPELLWQGLSLVLGMIIVILLMTR